MLLTIRAAVCAILMGLGTIGIGGVILWQVAILSRSSNRVAYVHIMVTNVEITVDDVEYQIETLSESPLVCVLRPGRHVLSMRLMGKVLFEEEFSLGTREEIILTAWQRPSDAPTNPFDPKTALTDRPSDTASPAATLVRDDAIGHDREVLSVCGSTKDGRLTKCRATLSIKGIRSS